MVVKRIKEDELYHHGVKGQRWGVRRYQNPDGSLTDKGRKKYLKQAEKYTKSPIYQGHDQHQWVHNKIRNKTEVGKAVFNKKNIKDAENNFKKANELNNYIEHMTSEQFNKENEIFKDKLKKAGIKYDTDELHWSINQMVCANRGINPKEYSKKLSSAQENYSKAIEQEVEKFYNTPLMNDKNAKRAKEVINNISNDAVLSINPKYYEDMYSMFAYEKEDAQILDKLIKTN